MIATQLHVASDLAPDDSTLAGMAAAPHFVISADVVDMMVREDVQRSIAAMIEAGISRLPYPVLLVEFSVTSSCRRFVLLKEGSNWIEAEGAVLVDRRLLSVSPSLARIGVSASGISVDRAADQAEGDAFGFAAALALLMLNVRGIEKQVIEVDRLNRARAKGGRSSIPRHSIVRIGTIYDRSGRAHNASGSGRHMPVHLRAGHTRMQPCGPGSVDRKPVYIAPVLVNYRDGADAPALPKRLVRA